jgi:fatty acid desaturase
MGLQHHADVRSLAIVAAKAGFVVAAWNAYPHLGLVARFFVSFALTIWAFYVSTIVHNAMHRDLWTHPKVESAWKVVLSGIYGFPVEPYKPTHNLNHHVLTNMTSDHLYTYKVMYGQHLLNLLLFLPSVFPDVTKLEQWWIAKESRKMSKDFLLWLVEQSLSYAIWGYLGYYDMVRFLCIWLLPNILAVDMILTMNVLQHDGCKTIAPGKHKGAEMEVDCARNFVGPVINFFTCNNGFHTIHHMHSRIHWSQYSKLHALLIKPRMDSQYDEQCIVRYLWWTFFWPAKLPQHRIDFLKGSKGTK